MTIDSLVTVDVRVDNAPEADEMYHDMRRSFTNRPIVLPPKWLYDDLGSELFDRITRLDEYYPTEAERSLLLEHAAEIAATTGADTVVELGSGTSDKTRTLLDAFHNAEQLQQFVPLDVSEATLVDAAHMLADRYDGLHVHALVGDFTRHLGAVPRNGRRLVAFLGGTLGNFYEEERRAFLGALGDSLDDNEWILLGVDLVKPVERILDAYDDNDGVTERFIKNVLRSLNERLDAHFDVAGFDYAPMWDRRQERVDMRLRSSVPQTVHIEALDLHVEFGEGEELRIEISTKFRPERLTVELSEAGFDVENFWVDGNDDFALVLARKSGSPSSFTPMGD